MVRGTFVTDGIPVRVLVAGALAGFVLSAAAAQAEGVPGVDPVVPGTPAVTAPAALPPATIPVTPDPAATPAPVPAQTAAPAPDVSAEFANQLEAWAASLDTRAQALERAPSEPVTRIGAGELLRKWSTGDRVQRLGRRLTELGLLPRKKVVTEFDDTIQAAIHKFQVEQGIRPDGLVGATTQQALDRSPSQNAAILRSSAQAMRDLRGESLPNVLLVNLPSQTVRLVRNGKLVLTMRAVVGRPERSTPLLRDEVTHVIVNPTWTVPPTVLKEDKLPNLRNTGRSGINNATVYLDGQVVMPEIVDWSAVTPNRVRIVQEPGDGNALGRFRFNLTNPYNIYLHGTNEPKAFDRELRTVSSGCVRLQDARLMAEEVLRPDGVDATRIDRMLERGKPQWVKLSTPLPVRFTYWMATVDETNRVRMHPDIYSVEEHGDTVPAASPAAKPARATPSPA